MSKDQHTRLKNIICHRMKQARVELGLTCTDVAHSLGATPQRYSNWERGVRSVSIENIHKLSEILLKPGAWLAGFDMESGRPNLIITITDDLMTPSLRKSDQVSIDTSDTIPTKEDLFAINIQGQIVIRSVQPEEGSYLIRSSQDKEWPSVVIQAKDASIIGRVNAITRKN